MSKSRVTIAIDDKILKKLDGFVKKSVFSNRSQAIQIAVKEKLERLDRTRLACECSKLDPNFEKLLAENRYNELKDF